LEKKSWWRDRGLDADIECGVVVQGVANEANRPQTGRPMWQQFGVDKGISAAFAVYYTTLKILDNTSLNVYNAEVSALSAQATATCRRQA